MNIPPPDPPKTPSSSEQAQEKQQEVTWSRTIRVAIVGMVGGMVGGIFYLTNRNLGAALGAAIAVVTYVVCRNLNERTVRLQNTGPMPPPGQPTKETPSQTTPSQTEAVGPPPPPAELTRRSTGGPSISISCNGRGRRFETGGHCLQVYGKLSVAEQATMRQAIRKAPDRGGPQQLTMDLPGRKVWVTFTKSEELDEITELTIQKLTTQQKAKKGSAAAPPPPPAAPEMPEYEVPLEPIELIAVSQKFRGKLDALLDDIKPHEGGHAGIDTGKFAAFGKQFMGQCRARISISDKGSHFHIQTKTEPPVSLGLWKPHFDGQVYYSTGGVGEALEIMDKICFVPEPKMTRTAAARPPQPPPPTGPAEPAGPADDLPQLINRDPELPRRLHALGNRTVRTRIPIDMGNLGQFQIVHVPDDGNCLFTAIGLFVGITDQRDVRRRIHGLVQDIRQGVRENPDPIVFTKGVLGRIEHTTNPVMRNGPWGEKRRQDWPPLRFKEEYSLLTISMEETSLPMKAMTPMVIQLTWSKSHQSIQDKVRGMILCCILY
ncbi:MAG: hypothetical protein LBB17_03405 [Puniceicoccales bacterium]|jgi:hypothetical protein|nr:hypothetical protein [Puniceicoccales bacterium]